MTRKSDLNAVFLDLVRLDPVTLLPLVDPAPPNAVTELSLLLGGQAQAALNTATTAANNAANSASSAANSASSANNAAATATSAATAASGSATAAEAAAATVNLPPTAGNSGFFLRVASGGVGWVLENLSPIINAFAGAAYNIFSAGSVVLRDSSGRIYTNFISISATSADNSAISKIAIEQNGDGFIRYRTPSNFFYTLGQLISMYGNRGRVVSRIGSAMSNNMTLMSGVIYMYYYGYGAMSVKMPPKSLSAPGDIVAIADIRYPGQGNWTSAGLTLLFDADVSINGAGGQSVLVNSQSKSYTSFMCSYVDSSYAVWVEI